MDIVAVTKVSLISKVDILAVAKSTPDFQKWTVEKSTKIYHFLPYEFLPFCQFQPLFSKMDKVAKSPPHPQVVKLQTLPGHHSGRQRRSRGLGGREGMPAEHSSTVGRRDCKD